MHMYVSHQRLRYWHSVTPNEVRSFPNQYMGRSVVFHGHFLIPRPPFRATRLLYYIHAACCLSFGSDIRSLQWFGDLSVEIVEVAYCYM